MSLRDTRQGRYRSIVYLFCGLSCILAACLAVRQHTKSCDAEYAIQASEGAIQLDKAEMRLGRGDLKRTNFDSGMMHVFSGSDMLRVRELLDTSPDTARITIFDQICRYCEQITTSQGDYSAVQAIVRQLDEAERRELVLCWVLGRQSRLGLEHDVAGQVQVASLLPATCREVAIVRIYEALGQRVSELEGSSMLGALTAKEFESICRGAASVSIEDALAAFRLNVSSDIRDAGIRAATRKLLTADSGNAGGHMLALDDQELKDVMLSETVRWLLERSSGQEARLLLNEIGDAGVRARLCDVFPELSIQ